MRDCWISLVLKIKDFLLEFDTSTIISILIILGIVGTIFGKKPDHDHDHDEIMDADDYISYSRRQRIARGGEVKTETDRLMELARKRGRIK